MEIGILIFLHNIDRYNFFSMGWLVTKNTNTGFSDRKVIKEMETRRYATLNGFFGRLTRRLRQIQLPGVSLEGPSSTLIILLITIVSLFLLSGGVYNVIIQPPVLFPSPNFPIFYTYSLHEQSWSESLIAFLLFSLGTAGGYLSYRSTRYGYKPRQAAMLLVIGVIMLFLAFVGCEYIIWLKRGF